MSQGTIKSYNRQRGFGFIQRESEPDLFFHFSGLAPGYIPQAHELVEFDVSEGRKGPQAVNISRVMDGTSALSETRDGRSQADDLDVATLEREATGHRVALEELLDAANVPTTEAVARRFRWVESVPVDEARTAAADLLLTEAALARDPGVAAPHGERLALLMFAVWRDELVQRLEDREAQYFFDQVARVWEVSRARNQLSDQQYSPKYLYDSAFTFLNTLSPRGLAEDNYLQKAIVDVFIAVLRETSDPDTQRRMLESAYAELRVMAGRVRDRLRQFEDEMVGAQDFLRTLAEGVAAHILATQPPPSAWSWPFDRDEFDAILGSGDSRRMASFLSRYAADLRNVLAGRIGVDVNVTRLEPPDVTIYARAGVGSGKSRQEDREFVEIKRLIDQERYSDALARLMSFSRQVVGHNVLFAMDWRAYALARSGGGRDRLEARKLWRELLFERRYTNARAAWNFACLTTESDPIEACTALYRSLTFPKAAYDNLLGLLPMAAAGALPREVDGASVYGRLPSPEAVLLAFVDTHSKPASSNLDRSSIEQDLLRLSKNLEKPLTAEREAHWIHFDVEPPALSEMANWFLDHELPLAGAFWAQCFRNTDFRRGTHPLTHQFLSAMYEHLGDRPALLRARKSEVDALARFERLYPQQDARLREVLPLALRDALELQQWREWDALFRLAEARRLVPHQELEALHREATAKQSPAATTVDIRPAVDPATELRAEVLTLQNIMVSVDTAEAFRDRLTDGLIRVEDLLRATSWPRAETAASLIAKFRGIVRDWLAAGSEQAKEPVAKESNAVSQQFSDVLREMGTPAEETLQQLAYRFTRLSHNFMRDTRLVPTPTAMLVGGVDRSASESLIAIQLKNETGVVLKNLSATLELIASGARVVQFDPRIVQLEPGRSVVVSFPFSSTMHESWPVKMRFHIAYAAEGLGELRSETRTMELRERSFEPPGGTVDDSFIFERSLETNEIADHFVGREAEQHEVLQQLGTGTQNRVFYLEGIRSVGKTSFIHSLIHEFNRIDTAKSNVLPVPIYLQRLEGVDKATVFMQQIGFQAAQFVRRTASIDVNMPDVASTGADVNRVFNEVMNVLEAAVPQKRVLLLIDEFQVLYKEAEHSDDRRNFEALLNLMRAEAVPSGRVLFFFTGQEHVDELVQRGNRLHGAGPKLRRLPIDFLEPPATRKILEKGFSQQGVKVLEESHERVYEWTAGHPDLIQLMGALFVARLNKERRLFVTPVDVDRAAGEAVSSSNALRLWYPPAGTVESGVEKDLRRFMEGLARYCDGRDVLALTMSELRAAVPKELEVHASSLVTLALNRKFLVARSGVYAFKCRLLHAWIMSQIHDIARKEALSGKVAVFVDVENISHRDHRGAAQSIRAYAARFGELSEYCLAFGKAGSIALHEFGREGFGVYNPPGAVENKREIVDKELQSRAMRLLHSKDDISTFIIVSGDRDFMVLIRDIWDRRKKAVVVAPRGSHFPGYVKLAQEMPSDKFEFQFLENVIGIQG
jgi:CspA family cold shock protein